ncbi:MAG: acylphosphatase [bacterium]|nr:acylphosphatase [bacterium]
MRQAKIIVHGHVQGVFFREKAKKIADKFDLTGWIKNESGGAVQILAEGKKEHLDKLAEWCHVGTKLSRILKVDVSWGDAAGEFDQFDIR